MKFSFNSRSICHISCYLFFQFGLNKFEYQIFCYFISFYLAAKASKKRKPRKKNCSGWTVKTKLFSKQYSSWFCIQHGFALLVSAVTMRAIKVWARSKSISISPRRRTHHQYFITCSDPAHINTLNYFKIKQFSILSFIYS